MKSGRVFPDWLLAPCVSNYVLGSQSTHLWVPEATEHIYTVMQVLALHVLVMMLGELAQWVAVFLEAMPT